MSDVKCITLGSFLKFRKHIGEGKWSAKGLVLFTKGAQNVYVSVDRWSRNATVVCILVRMKSFPRF